MRRTFYVRLRKAAGNPGGGLICADQGEAPLRSILCRAVLLAMVVNAVVWAVDITMAVRHVFPDYQSVVDSATACITVLTTLVAYGERRIRPFLLTAARVGRNDDHVQTLAAMAAGFEAGLRDPRGEGGGASCKLVEQISRRSGAGS